MSHRPEEGRVSEPISLPITVDLHDLANGKRGTLTMIGLWLDGEFQPFNWSDGNYSCDCNRSLFLARAMGEPEEANPPCGDGRIRVRITAQDGALLFTDEIESAATDTEGRTP